MIEMQNQLITLVEWKYFYYTLISFTEMEILKYMRLRNVPGE